MKTVKEIWDGMRPHQTDEQMARLMFCKAQRLEEINKTLLSAMKYVVEEITDDNLKTAIKKTIKTASSEEEST